MGFFLEPVAEARERGGKMDRGLRFFSFPFQLGGRKKIPEVQRYLFVGRVVHTYIVRSGKGSS